MKKLIILGVLLLSLTGCTVQGENPETEGNNTQTQETNKTETNNDETTNTETNNTETSNEEANNTTDEKEEIPMDKNWNIPVKGQLTGVVNGIADPHSIEFLAEDGNIYAVSILNLPDENYDELEANKTKITIEYEIKNEGEQLTLLKIVRNS